MWRFLYGIQLVYFYGKILTLFMKKIKNKALRYTLYAVIFLAALLTVSYISIYIESPMMGFVFLSLCAIVFRARFRTGEKRTDEEGTIEDKQEGNE